MLTTTVCIVLARVRSNYLVLRGDNRIVVIVVIDVLIEIFCDCRCRRGLWHPKVLITPVTKNLGFPFL